MAKAEAEAEKASQPLEQEHAVLLTSLENFCRRHQPELGRLNGHSRRSRRLLFGRLGFRASQAIVVGEEAKALRALARWKPGERFLRVRTELDRESLRDFLLSSSRPLAAIRKRLRRAGIYLERRQNWFYEIDPKAVERWGGRA
jgi:phage host-nuclease inhibitor protein Gam